MDCVIYYNFRHTFVPCCHGLYSKPHFTAGPTYRIGDTGSVKSMVGLVHIHVRRPAVPLSPEIHHWYA